MATRCSREISRSVACGRFNADRVLQGEHDGSLPLERGILRCPCMAARVDLCSNRFNQKTVFGISGVSD